MTVEKKEEKTVEKATDAAEEDATETTILPVGTEMTIEEKGPYRDTTVAVDDTEDTSVIQKFRLAGRYSRDTSRACCYPFVLVMEVLGIISASIVFHCILALSTVIPLAMIVIGTIYWNQCPAQKFIPIYLVVGGAIGTLGNSGLILFTRSEYKKATSCSLYGCVQAALFIAGNVAVFSIFQPEYENMDDSMYCNKTLYLFAFFMVSSTYILVAISIAVTCCLVTMAIWTDRGDVSLGKSSVPLKAQTQTRDTDV